MLSSYITSQCVKIRSRIFLNLQKDDYTPLAMSALDDWCEIITTAKTKWIHRGLIIEELAFYDFSGGVDYATDSSDPNDDDY